MDIRIGLFGSLGTIQQLEDYKKKWANVTIIPFTYNNPQDSIKLVQQAFGCDVYLFTGPVPYLYAKKVITEIDIPSTFVPFDQLMISNAFNLLQIRHQCAIKRISIDIMHKHHVLEIIEALNIQSDDIYIYNFDNNAKLEIGDIVDYHVSLWFEGKIDMALTSISEVEKRLQEKGIKCMKMPIPQKNVELAFREAKTLGELKLSQTSKIVIGFVKVKNMDKVLEDYGDFQVEKLFLSLHQILLNFTHEMDLSLYKGNNQFVIFGTKGSLDKLVSNDILYSYIKEIENKLKVIVVLGFGSGSTAAQAEANAKKAMVRSLQDDISSCYLYSELGEYVYLLQTKNKFQKESIVNKIMQDGSVTRETASNFTDFLVMRDFHSFTTQELATYENITIRSAARFIKKMVASGLLELAGEEKLYGKGRPRSIYQLKEIKNE